MIYSNTVQFAKAAKESEQIKAENTGLQRLIAEKEKQIDLLEKMVEMLREKG